MAGMNIEPIGAGSLYRPSYDHESCGIGFVADLQGRPAHGILSDALTMLERMEHRGATGTDPDSGDGAGVLLGIPHDFVTRVFRDDCGIEVPSAGSYGLGMLFLPTEGSGEPDPLRAALTAEAEREGLVVAGWRPVPIDPDGAKLGPTARSTMPGMAQVLLTRAEGTPSEGLEDRLYRVRKRTSRQLRSSGAAEGTGASYIVSLSSRTTVYKGMLRAIQLRAFFPDLQAPDLASHLAMVHSRFSTNTFPSWDRAQPLRFLAHNGEINTLRGNLNGIRARERNLSSPELPGEVVAGLLPICEPGSSDSGSLDHVLELLVRGGRSLSESMMMLIPPAWQNDPGLPPEVRAFHEFHSALLEPWDGPASVVFTDGRVLGAVLDRNGLRPSRYCITDEGRIVLSSESGSLPVSPERVVARGRVRPGRMLLVDFEEGRVVPDPEVKERAARRRPWSEWLRDQVIELEALPLPPQPPVARVPDSTAALRAFGYSSETLQFVLSRLVLQGKDPLGSMGNDAALACLSRKPRALFDYLQQRFAQVTNPPIDSIREEGVMSLETFIGPEANLLSESAEAAHRIRLRSPLLDAGDRMRLRSLEASGWRSSQLDATWDPVPGTAGLRARIEGLCREAEGAARDGVRILIVTDRAIGPDRVPVGSLPAVGAIHHHLVRTGLRDRVAIVAESGDAREVHHFCTLFGFGADAVYPWLADEALLRARDEGLIPADLADEEIFSGYRSAVAKGMLKVMAKMGISTLHSYRRAQLFDAVGLAGEVIDLCFEGLESPIGGIGFEVLATEALLQHQMGYGPEQERGTSDALPNPGLFHWRENGEARAWNPATIHTLQEAARNGDPDSYQRFASLVNEQTTVECHLRGLLELSPGAPVPLEEVEPASAIVRRFATGAMSFGSLSAEAHETLAVAMNRIGGRSNSGEGGEDASRGERRSGGDSARSAIRQVASGRFGVTSLYLMQADEMQIKMAQGAKPGEGGELPGDKVDRTIASVRHSTPGVGLISPPPHHDIYSIEDLAELIFDLRNANPDAQVSVKLVSGAGVGTIAAGVVKAGADSVLISGADGGTGASPLTSIRHAGLPWELGLSEAHQTLVLNGLRDRVRVQADGQLKTGRDVVIAALLGADEFGFATAPLITMGCIMMRKCHLNTCPVGIATQNPELRKRFRGTPEHVVNYLFQVAEEARGLLASLGFRSLSEAVGRVDRLRSRDLSDHWKARSVDLSPLMAQVSPVLPAVSPADAGMGREHPTREVLDRSLIEACRDSLAEGRPTETRVRIENTDRAVGTLLGSEVTRRYGGAGLPEGTIRVRATGSAGQSLGAWMPKGISLEVWGDANDYVGKGLCGGQIVVRPDPGSPFRAEEQVIVGNAVLYGATSGVAFFRGIAAERFAVRNSGARTVVEGVGDHGCEYMTGGRAVILGSVGRNFAAGMSGGIVWVHDPEDRLASLCHRDLWKDLERLEGPAGSPELQQLLQLHADQTDSPVARALLAEWNARAGEFVRIIPVEYRRYRERQAGMSTTAAGLPRRLTPKSPAGTSVDSPFTPTA